MKYDYDKITKNILSFIYAHKLVNVSIIIVLYIKIVSAKVLQKIVLDDSFHIVVIIVLVFECALTLPCIL